MSKHYESINESIAEVKSITPYNGKATAGGHPVVYVLTTNDVLGEEGGSQSNIFYLTLPQINAMGKGLGYSVIQHFIRSVNLSAKQGDFPTVEYNIKNLKIGKTYLDWKDNEFVADKTSTLYVKVLSISETATMLAKSFATSEKTEIEQILLQQENDIAKIKAYQEAKSKVLDIIAEEVKPEAKSKVLDIIAEEVKPEVEVDGKGIV